MLSKELGPVISAYKPRLAEDGTEGGEEKLTDQDCVPTVSLCLVWRADFRPYYS